MREVLDLVSRPRWAATILACLMGATIGANAMISDQNNGSNPDTDTDQPDDPEIRFEDWVFVSIPDFGIVPMQDAMDPSSESNLAMMLHGAPFEAYEPVSVHATNQDRNNGAVLIYMLPQRCLGDFNSDGIVNLYDTALFVELFLAGDLRADLTFDGVVDVLDQMAFILLTTMPCVDYWSL